MAYAPRMPTLFTKIIAGEIPGRFVWKDDLCVAIMTIAPLKPGHVMVVPREEVDHWIDASPELLAHLMGIAQKLGKAVDAAFKPSKVGLAVVGLEVPHLHIHLSPIEAISDLDFTKASPNVSPESLDAAADKLRAALRDLGYGENVSDS